MLLGRSSLVWRTNDNNPVSRTQSAAVRARKPCSRRRAETLSASMEDGQVDILVVDEVARGGNAVADGLAGC